MPPVSGPFYAELIQLARFRADGTRISAAEVIAYLEQVRFASSVVDGEYAGVPGYIFVSLAVDDDLNIARLDGVTRQPLDFISCTRSILHHFNTIAVFDDAVVDQLGNGHNPDDLPEELKLPLDSIPEKPNVPAVHVYKSHDSMNASFLAAVAHVPVQTVTEGDFVLVRDPEGRSHDALVELVSKGELPAVSLANFGGRRSVLAEVRVGLSKCKFAFNDGTPIQTLVATFGNAEAEELLRADSRFEVLKGKKLPEALHNELLAAPTDSDEFFVHVLSALGIGHTASDWLAGVEPSRPIGEVKPQSVGKIIRSNFTSAFDDQVGSSRVFGAMRRFLRRHPFVGLIWGTLELAIAMATVYFLPSEGWVAVAKWFIGFLWLLDGIAILTVSYFSLHQRGGHQNEDPV